MDPRLFWKIIVDVGADGNIRVIKELALWYCRACDSPGRVWQRLLWERIPLNHKIGPSGAGVRVEGDGIFFDGGYLVVEDPGLAVQARNWGIVLRDGPGAAPSKPVVLDAIGDVQGDVIDFLLGIGDGTMGNRILDRCGDAIRQPDEEGDSADAESPESQFCVGDEDGIPRYLGENVRIDAVVERDAADAPVGTIFHYPQDRSPAPHEPAENRVVLAEVMGDVSRKIEWQISEQLYESEGHYELTRRYRLAVAHELQTGSTNTYQFGMTVDAVPLVPHPRDTNPAHAFTLGAVAFHVGYDPLLPENVWRGTIWHIVFDPNASCQSCPD